MTCRMLLSIFRLHEEHAESSQPRTGDTDAHVGHDQVMMCLKPRAMNFALGVREIHPCAQRQRNPGRFGKGEIQVEFSFRKVSAGNKTLQPVYIITALAQTVFWGLCSQFWAGSQLNSLMMQHNSPPHPL